MEELSNCPMIVRNARSGGFLRTNEAFQSVVGYSDSELAAKPLTHWVEPRDHAALEALIESGEGCCQVQHRSRSGNAFPLAVKITRREDEVLVLGRCAMSGNLADLLDEDVDSATVSGTLHTIARIVEEQVPGYQCSILLVEDGRFVRGAGPSLPEEYNAAVDGYAIGPTVGSCGTAIFWNVPVIAEDIQADPLWSDLAPLAKKAGVAACWSHPFTSRNGHVLGALALYAPEPEAPTDEQLRLLRAAARMTGLAVERGRAEEALREQRKREQELEGQLRQAAKMEALGVLAGGVAHDFNNVLGTILGNAEYAKEIAPQDDRLKGLLDKIIEASQRAGRFCQQMLAYSGNGKASISRFEFSSLLPQLSSLVQAALSKKASLKYSLYEGAIYLEGDENQLLQVIMNLVINASDSLGDSEGCIEVGTKLVHYDAQALHRIAPQDDLPAGEYVRLTVRDNGCGIEADNLDRIFDPFFTTKSAGRGLGLAAVKGIVVSHRGAIQIDSEPGKGTTFEVLFPTIAPPESHDQVPQPLLTKNERKRILLADDDDSLRAITSVWLAHSGYDVVEAADGSRAVSKFCEDPDAIDCVLLDLNMPKLSGNEVHRELKAVREDVPIILMSGCAEQEILDRFAGAEYDGFLQKPAPASDIVAAIHEACLAH